jgi:hypothetical protein
MYKTCFLHIGPPKTGSTSVQQTLWKNRELLAKSSIHYPELEKNHRFLVSCFMNEPQKFDYNKLLKRTDEEIVRVNFEKLKQFKNESDTTDCRTLILSSEHLVLLKVEEIMKLKQYLFEICEDVKILIYLRHPISSVGSFIQESIKNGNRHLSEMRQKPPFSRFGHLIPKWEECFGTESVVLREMHSNSLINKDLIDDFLNIIGYSGDSSKIKRVKANESLSAPAVLIADALTLIAPKFSADRKNSNYLSEIKGPKYIPDQEILNKTMELAKPHLEYLEQKWGISLHDVGYENKQEDNVFNAETIKSIAEILNRLSRGKFDTKI